MATPIEAGLQVIGDASQTTVRSTGSSVSRKAAVRAADLINARDWGAALNGSTDDRGVLAAISLYYPSAYKTLVIDGPCYVSSSISLGANLPVRFEGAGSFVGPGTVTYTRWGMEAWTAPTLLNSWTVYSGRTPGYLKDAFGFVHIRGTVTGGAAGTVAFTLPAGYRPAQNQIFPVMTQLSTPPAVDGAVRGQVSTNGNIELAINPPSGWVTGTWVDLSTITFRAEQ